MSVRKRFNKWWVDFRFNGTRYRKRSPDNTRAGAIVYENLLRQKLARGEDISDDKKEPQDAGNKKQETFGEFAWQWFEIHVKSNYKFSEILSKKSILKASLIPFFGEKLLCKISNLEIEEYKSKKLKSGLSQKTINNHLNVLSRCLRTAKEWNIIENFPNVKRLKVMPQKYDFLLEAESQQLINSSSGMLKEMILLALKTGLRFGEIIALDWSDVDLEMKLLTVRRAIVRERMGSTKNNKIRYIPLTKDVCTVLSARFRRKGFVFVDKNNSPLKQSYCRRALGTACKKAGLRKIGWHVLRHTFASQLAKNNVPMKAIQELLGHADLTTTMRYAHVSHSTLRDAVKTLEGNYFGHNMVTIPQYAS